MRVKKKKHGAERMAACGDIVISDLNREKLEIAKKELETKGEQFYD